MRKRYYLVAILLLMGGTFTSCLDNDEPAGIEQMRGAKAELYKAQAAVQTAEVGIKEADAKIKLAEAQQKEAKAKTTEIKNQLLEMDLAIKQAGSDAEIARLNLEKKKYELQMDSIQENYKSIMLNLETETARAQHNYDLAIKELAYLKNKVNPTYAKRLNAVTNKLTTSMGLITMYKNQIMDKQRELMIFTAGYTNEYVEAKLTAAITEKENGLKVAQKALEDLKDVVGTPVEEWEAKGEELLAAMEDIDLQIDTLKMDIAELTNTKAPWEEKKLAAKRKLGLVDNTDSYNEKRELSLTVPAAIQDGFVENVLKKVSVNSLLNGSKLYVQKEGKYVLVGGDNLKVGGFTLTTLMNELGEGNQTLSSLVKGQLISDENYAQAVEHLKTLEGNMKDYQAIFTAELPKWEAARDQYIKDKDAYFIYQDFDLRENTIAAVDKYKHSKKEKADKDALIKVLTDYYKVRAALDSVQPKYNDGTADKVIVDALSADKLDDILTATGNMDNLLGAKLDINRNEGGQDEVSSVGVDAQKGSQGAFYAKCMKLWGENSGNVIIRYTAVTPEDFAENTDIVGNGSEAYNAFNSEKAYNDFKNQYDFRAEWQKLYTDLETLTAAVVAEADALNADLRAYEAEINKIEAQITAVKQQQYDLEVSKNVYQNILNVITGYLDETGGITYEAALKALKEQIGDQEAAILEAQKALNEANAALEAWKQDLDADGIYPEKTEEDEEIENVGVKAYIATLNKDIEVLQEKLAKEQKRFEVFTAEKNALMDILVGVEYSEN